MLKLIFTGVGGQGIITAGVVLAEAAVVAEGRYATQSQSYGAEARGGLTRTDVILSDSEVLYPTIEQTHVLAALHQRGYNAHAATLRPGGVLVYDEDQVHPGPKADARCVPLPLLQAGRGANIALLGVLCELIGAVSCDSIRSVLDERYGAGSPNHEAFDLGIAMVRSGHFGPMPFGRSA